MQTTPTVPPMTTTRPPVHEPPVPHLEQQHREQAIKRIRDKNVFKIHLVVYLVINAAFLVVWAMSGADYFWPIFVMLLWGAGVAIHGYSVYGGNDKMTEAQIEREMKRMP
jgi:hypothetical protein